MSIQIASIIPEAKREAGIDPVRPVQYWPGFSMVGARPVERGKAKVA
jgi:hypothetical protein